MRPAAIGVDVGGTKILGVVTDASGRIDHREKRPTPRGEVALADAIVEVVSRLLERSDAVDGIGIGLPGLVDRSGVLRYGPNVPGVTDFDVVPSLRPLFDGPIRVENDGTCAALAEHRLGAARGHQHAVVVTQGTGIGGGLIVDGRVVLGANGFAGEPGHMPVDPVGPRCACGSDGCWESVASGAGLATIARRHVATGSAERLLALAGETAHITAEHVATAVGEGDADALRIVEEFAGWVAYGLTGLVALLDPGVVVLGGGLANMSESFLSGVGERLDAMIMGAGHRPPIPVVAAELGPSAGAVGAALLVFPPELPA